MGAADLITPLATIFAIARATLLFNNKEVTSLDHMPTNTHDKTNAPNPSFFDIKSYAVAIINAQGIEYKKELPIFALVLALDAVMKSRSAAPIKQLI